jgi:hypothetical protein
VDFVFSEFAPEIAGMVFGLSIEGVTGIHRRNVSAAGELWRRRDYSDL